MAYSKTVWVNDNAPALNATNLNKIEQGIYDNANSIDDILTGDNVTLAGNLTLENHASAVGWYDLHNNTSSLSSSTSYAKITASEITLSPGRYILMASANFSSSTSGFRGIAIGDTSASFDESKASQATLSSSGWTTSMTTSCFVNITTTTKVYMYAFQNSGSSLSTAWMFKAVRIR